MKVIRVDERFTSKMAVQSMLDNRLKKNNGKTRR
jgi:putative Holliday junction resolvase